MRLVPSLVERDCERITNATIRGVLEILKLTGACGRGSSAGRGCYENRKAKDIHGPTETALVVIKPDGLCDLGKVSTFV